MNQETFTPRGRRAVQALNPAPKLEPDKPQTWDYDRGVLIAYSNTGQRIAMYVDSPGVYLNDAGQEVSEAVAKAAGFDVGRYSAERRQKDMANRVAEHVASLSAQQPQAQAPTAEELRAKVKWLIAATKKIEADNPDNSGTANAVNADNGTNLEHRVEAAN